MHTRLTQRPPAAADKREVLGDPGGFNTPQATRSVGERRDASTHSRCVVRVVVHRPASIARPRAGKMSPLAGCEAWWSPHHRRRIVGRARRATGVVLTVSSAAPSPSPSSSSNCRFITRGLVGEVASAAAMVERPTRWRVTPTSVPRRQLGLGLLALLLLGQRADWATASRATHKPKRRSKATSAAPPTEDPPPLLRFPAAGPHADDW
jgi:hypothetical protein